MFFVVDLFPFFCYHKDHMKRKRQFKAGEIYCFIPSNEDKKVLWLVLTTPSPQTDFFDFMYIYSEFDFDQTEICKPQTTNILTYLCECSILVE